MSRKKKFVTAASTFSVALGIGFIMQNGDAVASRSQPEKVSTLPVAAAPENAIPQDVNVASAFVVPEVSLPQAKVESVELVALSDGLGEVEAPVMNVPMATTEPSCEIDMTADTLPLAMVALSINAPCNPLAAVTIHHQGLMFAYLTDEEGRLDLLAPAMAEEAFFISSFANGEGAVASTTVPEIGTVDRAALQWQGVNAAQLHAREFGADYGTEGHVWKAAAREVDFAHPDRAGFLTGLGDPRVANPMMVEIYTYPSATGHRDGNVALTVEVEVTQENCGREIAAQSIQLNPNFDPTAIDLTMTLPDCDAIGEFLVLKNMFKDLTLAAK